MTRKDFQLIADVLKETCDTSLIAAALRTSLAKQFADKLASTNPNFDRARFLRACGVEG